MRVYVLEYDFEPMTVNLTLIESEHKIETFSDVTKFINRVKYVKEQYYNSEIKVYSGEVVELNINRVLNPL